MSNNSNVDLVMFQKRLNKNLEESSIETEASSLIGFTSGNRNWLVALDCLREVEGVPPSDRIQNIALTKPFVIGIANFKGLIYTMIDWQSFLGGGYSQITLNARSLLFHTKLETTAALVVSEVTGIVSRSEVIELEKGQWEPSTPWSSHGYKTKDGKKWELIDLHLLATSKEMLDIEAV